MASVSSGNIKSYEVLNGSQLPDGSWGVTLKALVSVDKLSSFVAAKGIAIEIKGGMFALNIKQQLLNEQGEIVSQFKHGGFVVYEKNGHGLVAAITDLGSMDWNSAKTACDGYRLNGYSDWHLPSKEELNALYVNLFQLGVGGFVDHTYWSSTEKMAPWRGSRASIMATRGTTTATSTADTLFVL